MAWGHVIWLLFPTYFERAEEKNQNTTTNNNNNKTDRQTNKTKSHHQVGYLAVASAVAQHSFLAYSAWFLFPSQALSLSCLSKRLEIRLRGSAVILNLRSRQSEMKADEGDLWVPAPMFLYSLFSRISYHRGFKCPAWLLANLYILWVQLFSLSESALGLPASDNTPCGVIFSLLPS